MQAIDCKFIPTMHLFLLNKNASLYHVCKCSFKHSCNNTLVRAKCVRPAEQLRLATIFVILEYNPNEPKYNPNEPRI